MDLESLWCLFILMLSSGLSTEGLRSNESMEHQIRSDVLNDYDKIVVPPGNQTSKEALRIQFALIFTQLNEVKNKEQLVIVDVWYILAWENRYLAWDETKYHGKKRVPFSPSEIWVPDIALHNNGDPNLQMAGGRSKFLTTVTVDSSGRCVWSGPASFIFSCSMQLQYWPFDEQKCTMKFGSLSYGNNLLDIEAFETKKTISDDFPEGGNWVLKEATVTTEVKDYGNCCPYNFTQIQYTLKLTRKFDYHMFYLVAPCLILTILAVLGFYIPSESGERIGFITTLLLAMMVFLLLIPDMMPESSESIPTLGIFMMATLVVITAILLVTIGILVCYHSQGTPPAWVQKLFCLKASGRTSPRVEVELERRESKLTESALRAAQPFNGRERPGTGETTSKIFLDDNRGRQGERLTYQDLASKLDSVGMLVFVIIICVMYSIILVTGTKGGSST